jgi:hypothetical protein
MNGSAILTAVAVNGWTADSCQKANPVKQWKYEGFWMMISYSIAVIFWTLNTIIGNNGNSMNSTFMWYFFFHLMFVPLTTIFLEVWAVASYGTRLMVVMAWTGQTGVTQVTAQTVAQETLALADVTYLLFKSVAQEAVPSGNYSLLSNLIDKGYDKSYTVSWWLVMFVGLSDLILSGYCYNLFGRVY